MTDVTSIGNMDYDLSATIDPAVSLETSVPSPGFEPFLCHVHQLVIGCALIGNHTN